MKVNSMDEERISISKIKNIVSIGFSDLALARIENSETEYNDRLVDDVVDHEGTVEKGFYHHTK